MKFHHEINILKSILQENIYLHDFVDNCIKEFFGSVPTPKIVVTTVTKKGLMIVLPYLGKFSLQIRTRINRVMKNKLPDCNFRIIFQAKCKLINFFAFKDRILVFLRCVLALFIKLSAVAAMLPIMAKLSTILTSECVNTPATTGKKMKG